MDPAHDNGCHGLVKITENHPSGNTERVDFIGCEFCGKTKHRPHVLVTGRWVLGAQKLQFGPCPSGPKRMPKPSGSWRKSLLGALPTPTLSVSRLSVWRPQLILLGGSDFSFPRVCGALQLKSSQEALGDGMARSNTTCVLTSPPGSLSMLPVSPLNCLMTLIECVLAVCRALRLLSHQTEPAAFFLKSLRSAKSPRATVS